MFRLILQTQGRLEGFSVLSHLLSQKVPSSVLTISSVHWSLQVGCWWRVGRGWGECPFVDPEMVASDGIIWEHFMDPLSVQENSVLHRRWSVASGGDHPDPCLQALHWTLDT